MDKIKILLVNDLSSVGYMMQKYTPFLIDIIYFYDSPTLSINREHALFFKKGLINQIKQIKELATMYDHIICLGWQAATVCYLAGVPYIMYFQDEYINPDKRIYKKRKKILALALNHLYGKILKNASHVIGCDPNNTAILRKYYHNATMIPVLLDRDLFDTVSFDTKIESHISQKFIFFSPTRIEPQKYTLDMMEAIKLTTSDFLVLQVDWGKGDYYDKVVNSLPDKVQLIEKIPRDQMASYYKSVDALLGQVSPTTCGNIEREAIMCGTPVFAYVPISFSSNDPFFKSKKPENMAKEIDHIVNDTAYRKELATRQYTWIYDTFNNAKTIDTWRTILKSIRYKKIKGNTLYVYLIKLYIKIHGRKLKNEH